MNCLPVGELRARRKCAERDHLASLSPVRKSYEEVLPMVTKVRSRARLLVPTTLVVVGWIAFGAGMFTDVLAFKIILLSLARVLP